MNSRPPPTEHQHRFKLPIRTEETLRLFVQYAWGVTIPNQQVCPHHTSPWRAFADAYFARDSVTVWLASRGFGGKTYLLSVLALTEALTLGADPARGIEVNVLGGSGQQSTRVIEHSRSFWQYRNAPKQLLESEASSITRLRNGSKIMALLASQASVRGPHPARLRMDEVDEMQLEILDAAMGQPMEQNGVLPQTVMSSTRQNSGGTMDEMLKRAATNSWPIYEWCYRENMQPQGWLSAQQVETKRRDVTHLMWQTEYENQEPNPATRAILPEAVELVFDPKLGQYNGSLYEYIELEAPQKGAMYVNAADWAKENDCTVIDTFRVDVVPIRLVAFERTGRLKWPMMVERYNLRCKRYPGSNVHDNTGLGDVVQDYLTVSATGCNMTGLARTQMLNAYISALENAQMRYPRIQSAYGEHKFASVKDVFGSGHLPDTFSAGALGWYAANHYNSSQDMRGLGHVPDYRPLAAE